SSRRKRKRPTLNAQRPTSNGRARDFILRSSLRFECWKRRSGLALRFHRDCHRSKKSSVRRWTFSSLVSERQCHDCAVEKWIDVAGWGTWITENRHGVGAVNIFVTPARDEKPGAGGEDDVVGQERPPFEPRAAIEREVVARFVGEQYELGRFG